MKKKFLIINVLLTLFLLVSCGKANNESTKVKEEENQVEESNNLDVASYSVKTVKGNEISKLYTGMNLSPVITVAEKNDKPFEIEITDIDEAYDIGEGGKIEMINSETGELIDFTRGEDGYYRLTTNLKEDIEYGILLNQRLVGAVRVVEDLNSINKEGLYNEISVKLSCGLQ